MNIHEQIRSRRGPTVGGVAPVLRQPPTSPSYTKERRRLLIRGIERSYTTFYVTPPIPEEDLRILEKIYHKEYEDCGRKRGSLLRYIKHYRETVEPVNHSRRLFKYIGNLVRKAKT